jgi:hypothetical protein
MPTCTRRWAAPSYKADVENNAFLQEHRRDAGEEWELLIEALGEKERVE